MGDTEIYVPSGPFVAWLHPVKCFRALVKVDERMRLLEDERTVRRRDVDSIMQRLSETQAQLDAARAETANLRGELAERGNELAASQAQVRRLTTELEEMQGLEAELEEFQAMLGRVEDMKRRYERRIETLRGKLKEMDAKAKINDELIIDMEAPHAPSPASRPKPQRPPDNDWLRELDPDL